MNKVQLIVVGGFLGAGKTTLLWTAARRLAACGKKIGLITNDQAPDLVDTVFLSQQGMAVQEVAGSCFCCNFPGLIKAAEKLHHDVQADILIAEPVGSCTDLSATLLQPLKEKFRQRFSLAPLSVLADPERLCEVLSGGPSRLHKSAAYIVRKQLEEADIIIINKSDLLSPERLAELKQLLSEHLPGASVHALSALTGSGVEEWIDAIGRAGRAGCRIPDVDYDTYAQGEAVLGWLNAVVRLKGSEEAVDWKSFCSAFLHTLQRSFRELSVEVGHVKVLLSGGGKRCIANLTQTDGEISVRCDDPPAASTTDFTINARVEMPSGRLEEMVRNKLKETCSQYRIAPVIVQVSSLTPGRPDPTYRYGGIVDP